MITPNKLSQEVLLSLIRRTTSYGELDRIAMLLGHISALTAEAKVKDELLRECEVHCQWMDNYLVKFVKQNNTSDQVIAINKTFLTKLTAHLEGK